VLTSKDTDMTLKIVFHTDCFVPGVSTNGVPPPRLGPSKTVRKRCKGVTKSGEPCTAWAMEGGLCYFHANPDKAAELGRNGGRRRKHTYDQATEPVAPPESAADVRRMLAETVAEVKAGKMDPKVANTVAYLGTVLLRGMRQMRLQPRLSKSNPACR
jgi:hypothetical protein